jgi:hypothetical protein
MIDAEAKIREGLGDTLNPAYYERFLDDVLVRLSDAESMGRRHFVEMTSIHTDMLALAAKVGVHYDGVSSPAGFLHNAIMPAIDAAQAELAQAREALQRAEETLQEGLVMANTPASWARFLDRMGAALAGREEQE